MPSDSDGTAIPTMDSDDISEVTMSRGRPLLLPTGRKLRHLNGIVVRNLTTSTTPSRPRGTSTDDDFLAGAWRTASKTLTATQQDESESSLHHSKSSSDLASGRPHSRRRSTRGLDGIVQKQKRLEDVRMSDVFFSLHIAELGDDPIYISEVIHKSMNPNFQSFDLKNAGPHISRRNAVIVKLWAGVSGDLQLLVELDITLPSLRFIGKSLENFPYPFSTNCIIFTLTDGIYTVVNDLPMPLPKELRTGGHNVSTSISSLSFSNENTIPSTSYDTVMKLNNLEECVNDAQMTTSKVSSQISSLLSREATPLSLLRLTAAATSRRDAVKKALATEKKRLENVTARRDNLLKSISSRRSAMALGKESQSTSEKFLEEATTQLERSRLDLAETKGGIEAQRRRIVNDLQQIYPIEPTPEHSLGFTIRGLYLPNSGHDDHDDEVISAALGYTARMVYQLGYYLGTYLRYPVQPVESSSFIMDPISVISGARTFPLWMKGSLHFRFEYGIFLLNKDIEQLMSRQGLSVMDLRNTLPNLKYLLLYMTSGNAPILERERPSSPFIQSLRRRPSERSPNGRSVSPAGSTHARRTMSLDIPKRDFVDLTDLVDKGEETYTSTTKAASVVGS
ncbi:uncharacterized protein LAJ45_07559 [Morchella importuna]|uniref:uncharacterized protein n=1 Tax=Morchella importuna TaxID=1174673 RepID=UPI001E8CD794|nr:uncharacterized protein LAJ45_07559 [Morchella importuna]KAH8148457.1 hypothetical protein LAJ45_07559 [Morchella importuna]